MRSALGGVECIGEYHQYTGEISSVHWRDIICAFEGYHLCTGGISFVHWGISFVHWRDIISALENTVKPPKEEPKKLRTIIIYSNFIRLVGDNLGVLFVLNKGSCRNSSANFYLQNLAKVYLQSPFLLDLRYIRSVK